MAWTDKQIADIIKDMVIICDNREKKNQHILDYLDKNNIPHQTEKMETADYSFVLPSYPQIGADRRFLVERKGSLNEVAGNLTKDRERFIREFERVQDKHIHMVMEGATWKRILAGTYRGGFNPTSYMASLITINIRYNCPIWFCNVEESPTLIFNILKYELREFLKTP